MVPNLALKNRSIVEWTRPRSLRSALGASARLLARLSLACSVLLCAGFWLGPERLWLFSLAQYAPYPVFLLPSALALAVSFMGGRWAVLSAVTASALVATYAMGLSLNLTPAARHDLRVMTFNIKDYITLQRRYGADSLAREIARHDPDVLLLQDARTHGDTDNDSVWARIIDGRRAYTFGQYVIASRLPMRECRNGWISFRDEPHSYASCIVRAGETDIDVMTVHFTTPRFGLAATRANPIAGLREWRQNVDDRMTQARTLAADVSRRTRPVIVGGDFNAPAHSLVIRTLEGVGLSDAFSASGFGYGFTWGHSLRTRFPFLRIDHVLASDELRPVDTTLGLASGSAHLPVIADYAFTARADTRATN